MNLLLIEDSPSDAWLLQQHLRESALRDARVEHVGSLAAATARLGRTPVDAVLLDLGLPDSSGLETFDRVREASPDTPVVVVTGLDDQHLGEQAVERGAQDYLSKRDAVPATLARAVAYAIRRRQLLEELEEAHRNQIEARDRFLSHVSHELRSPLAVVHQFVSLVADGLAGPLPAEAHDYLSVAMANVAQLKVMIDDLLDVGRLNAGGVAIHARPVCMRTLLRDAARAHEPWARKSSVRLRLRVHDLPPVHCDPARISEVLANLLSNALKFTPAGGSVFVGATAGTDMVRVTVSDTGRGIRQENLERIFERFYQEEQDDSSRNGLGLGLYICRKLVEAQGGSIWAESHEGGGTTFSFTLPRADDIVEEAS